MSELEIRIRNWLTIHYVKVGAFYRLSLASPLKMCSKFVLANWILLGRISENGQKMADG